MGDLYQRYNNNGYYARHSIDDFDDIDWEYSEDARGGVVTKSWIAAIIYQNVIHYELCVYQENDWFYYNIVDETFARYVFIDDMGAYEDETTLEELQRMLFEKLIEYLD